MEMSTKQFMRAQQDVNRSYQTMEQSQVSRAKGKGKAVDAMHQRRRELKAAGGAEAKQQIDK